MTAKEIMDSINPKKICEHTLMDDPIWPKGGTIYGKLTMKAIIKSIEACKLLAEENESLRNEIETLKASVSELQHRLFVVDRKSSVMMSDTYPDNANEIIDSGCINNKGGLK